MGINFKSPSTNVSPHVRAYAEQKVAVFEKYVTGSKEMQCDVELRDSGHHQKGPYYYAEVNVLLNGNLYRATAEKESFEAAIDTVKDEIIRELTKDKNKRRTLFHRGAHRIKEWVQELRG